MTRAAAGAIVALLAGAAACAEREPPILLPYAASREILAAADSLHAAGKFDEALVSYETAVAAQPGLLPALVGAADAARRAAQPEVSERHAREAIRRAPDHPPARIARARSVAGKSPREASRLVDPLLLAGNADALVAAAEIALVRGDPSGAMGHLRAALVAGGSPLLLLDVGRGMAGAGFHADAVRVVHRALDEGGPTPHARYTLAWSLEQAGRYEECVREYTALVKDHPAYLPPYRNLGALMARDGELERAIRLWDRALEHHPGDPGLRANIDEALEALGLELREGESG